MTDAVLCRGQFSTRIRHAGHPRIGEAAAMCRWHAEIASGMTTAAAHCMTIAIHQTGGSPGLALRAAMAPGRDAPTPTDNWLDALAKLVPGEVIIAFTAALHVSGVGDVVGSHLAIVALFAALCPVVLWASVRRTGTPAPWLQYVVRSTAFVLYGLASDPVLTDWLRQLGHLEWIPGVGALVVTMLAALVLSPPGAQRPPPELGPAMGDALGPRAASAPPPPE